LIDKRVGRAQRELVAMISDLKVVVAFFL